MLFYLEQRLFVGRRRVVRGELLRERSFARRGGGKDDDAPFKFKGIVVIHLRDTRRDSRVRVRQPGGLRPLIFLRASKPT
jgi:hypothetical protein